MKNNKKNLNLYLYVFSFGMALWAYYNLYLLDGFWMAASIFIAIWANNIQWNLKEKL